VQREAFEQFTRLEADHWWFRGRRTVYLGLLRHVLRGARPERALDLGCGVGGFLPGLAKVAERVVPLDFDLESAVHVSARDLPREVERPILSTANALPFADQSFDLVCLFDVLEHLDDDRAAVREVVRVLKPGGIAIASVPAYPWLYSNNDRVAGHRRRYTRATLADALRSAGLDVERNTHANVLLFPAIAAVLLCAKAWEAAFLQKRESAHTNLSWPLPRPVHSLLHACFAAELPFAARFDLPFGHSILALARKPITGSRNDA
jgi:SAM-dependent methyltransferase